MIKIIDRGGITIANGIRIRNGRNTRLREVYGLSTGAHSFYHSSGQLNPMLEVACREQQIVVGEMAE